ncbi:MAG: flagellar basal body P-ring protein FlgI [Rhodospirillales bacterium]|nr:flagellar basal body P-ring protein FlgI [Rhodospirillales bacterium]
MSRAQHCPLGTPSLRARVSMAFGLVTLFTLFLGLGQAVHAASRIKDITDLEGIRDNQLIGYGLVVGLDGDGDDLNNAPFTKQSLEAMLERMGVNTRGARTKTDNVAAVMVVSDLPPFARQGTRIDVVIGTLGDAEDLLGGTLLATPLLGADGEIYAVAQGPITVGGFKASGAAETVTKGVPTSGRIPNGAIVEREVGFEFASLTTLNIALRNPDFTTAVRIAEVINGLVRESAAIALDPGTVMVNIPERFKSDLVSFVSEMEQLYVEPDQAARIVVDEQTGIVVIGKDARISKIAIAQGNLTIRITETPQVSQPTAFSSVGETVEVPRTDVEVTEEKTAKMTVLENNVTLQDLVDGLNALGIGPRDMISILQAMKTAGAIQAEVVVM